MKNEAVNIFSNLQGSLEKEFFDTLLEFDGVKIERIISKGQSSPKDFWYDQPNAEWVIVLKGRAVVQFYNGTEFEMAEGDYLFIPPRQKHRVKSTAADEVTLWLAVHIENKNKT